jgi:hypothetical protein
MDARIAAIQTHVSTMREKKVVLLTTSRSVKPTEKAKIIPLADRLPVVRLGAPLTAAKQKLSRRHYRKPLADQTLETLAEQVYARINELATNSTASMSLATARRMVDRYGTGKVGQGLSVITHRRGIANPVGFLVIWLRSEELTYSF